MATALVAVPSLTPFSRLNFFRNWAMPHCTPDLIKYGDGVFYTEIDTPFDPQGEQAQDFIRLAREAVDEYALQCAHARRFSVASTSL